MMGGGNSFAVRFANGEARSAGTVSEARQIVRCIEGDGRPTSGDHFPAAICEGAAASDRAARILETHYQPPAGR